MDKINRSDLLQSAVKESGLIMKANAIFHNYSIGNQLTAIVQCSQRGLEPSLINTCQGWQALKRQVKKGEKAIELCRPLTRSRTNDDGEKESFTASFVWKPMSALAILSQPRKRSVIQISQSRPGHFASIRRLPN